MWIEEEEEEEKEEKEEKEQILNANQGPDSLS